MHISQFSSVAGWNTQHQAPECDVVCYCQRERNVSEVIYVEFSIRRSWYSVKVVRNHLADFNINGSKNFQQYTYLHEVVNQNVLASLKLQRITIEGVKPRISWHRTNYALQTGSVQIVL